MTGSIILLIWVIAANSSEESGLPNGSFETAEAGRPTGWQTHTWGGQAGFHYADVGRTGGHSVMVSSETGADAAWFAVLEVKPFSRYRLTGWVKTNNVTPTTGRGALFNLHNIQPVQSRTLVGTNDWTELEIVFETADSDFLQVNCLLGGWGLATGQAWYDDLRLELIETSRLKPEVVIHAGETGPLVSEYIYGQFIEHMGRSIYGGIWAEMLEDRKFFYPVGSDESSWKLAAAVQTQLEHGDRFTMNEEAPYVGEHSPEVNVGTGDATCGLSQGGLGLRKGNKYVGRIVLAGELEPGKPIEVSLSWGDGERECDIVHIAGLTPEYETYPLAFEAGAETDDGRLEIVGRGPCWFRVGAVSLMPAENVHGMRADTLALLKELDSPIYRWPGGNFVSGYDWKDGIGDPDRRPPRKNPAWGGLEHNDFGINEFLTFCRELGTEPYIVVNSGLGNAQSAAEEVEYVNGPPDSAMGRLRAQHGHPEPYEVKWWGIGNEMYGDWQLGHMPLEDYVKKHNEFARAMRAVDPGIRLIAVGNTGPWSETMLAECADYMDLLSEHFYCGDVTGLMAHVRQVPNAIRAKADAHRQYHRTIPGLAGKTIPIALDEWNYWHGPHLHGELGVRYFLKDALGVAAGIHEYARNSDVFFMANYAQTVNVLGCIKTTRTGAAFDTTGLVLKLYRHRFGAAPVAVSGSPAPLDVVCAWTDDRTALTLGIVNPTREPYALAFTVQNAFLTGDATLWTVTGSNEMAYNEPGREPQVWITETHLNGISDRLNVPPISVSLYSLPVK